MPPNKPEMKPKTPLSSEEVDDLIADIIEYLLNDEEDEEYATCPVCGHKQPDAGRNILCEKCGNGPMPTIGDHRSD